MEVLNFEQNSEEWFQARIGSIGGSSIAAVCAKGKGKTRKTLLYRMAGEILTGVPYEGYHNEHMQRGNDREDEARKLYEVITGCDVKQVGMVKGTNTKHVSPDGLVGNDGCIEIKCTIPSVHIETIDHGKVPAAYRKQIQWTLFITGRKWCDFISYCPEVKSKPIFIVRMPRNENTIEEINEAADDFIADLQKVVTNF